MLFSPQHKAKKRLRECKEKTSEIEGVQRKNKREKAKRQSASASMRHHSGSRVQSPKLLGEGKSKGLELVYVI
jgi:hypothetical protein